MSNITLKKVISNCIITNKYYLNSKIVIPSSYIHISRTLSIRKNPEKVNGNGDIQDISRLTKSLCDRVRGIPAVPYHGVYSFKKRALKADHLAYTISGRASGVDAGYCWPNEKELDELISDEKEYEMNLQEMMEQLNIQNNLKQSKRHAKEKKVLEQMSKMPKIIDEYRRRLQKGETVEASVMMKRKDEKDEAKEYFGFEIDPRDPRYEHMQEMKAEQIKQDKKLKKKEEKQARLLATLSTGSKRVKSQ